MSVDKIRRRLAETQTSELTIVEILIHEIQVVSIPFVTIDEINSQMLDHVQTSPPRVTDAKLAEVVGPLELIVVFGEVGEDEDMLAIEYFDAFIAYLAGDVEERVI